MNALDVLIAISENNNLLSANLRYCFVNQEKVPFNGLSPARPNNVADFLLYDDIDLSLAERFAGIGISIQASNICAIDVDHCFSKAFDLSSADERGQYLINLFKGKTYVEFSFSGTGLRILFTADEIEDYGKRYYIKNSKTQCEYYYPQGSNRYVTLTARPIINEGVNFVAYATLREFLDTYMVKPQMTHTERNSELVACDVENTILHFLRTDKQFQDNWFEKAPGSGSNESERDFFLVKFIYENITGDFDLLKEIFESSPFFKSKDKKHQYKWNNNNYRYLNYLYNVISGEN